MLDARRSVSAVSRSESRGRTPPPAVRHPHADGGAGGGSVAMASGPPGLEEAHRPPRQVPPGHWVPLTTTPSAGHVLVMPSQCSTTSQTEAADRQMTEEAVGPH